jgi:nucleoside-diphosphate-sugar epimerase/choline dehydrogenase-like flavoprotein
MSESLRTHTLVIGSGAGGALTAATLAEHGYEVVLVEEGPHIDTADIASNSPEALARLCRNGGMTPILGNQTIAFVEGRVVGGSTEVNSAFWHRLPRDCYDRWRTDVLLLEDFSYEVMTPYFQKLEQDLSVSSLDATHRPRSSDLFRSGIERLHWRYQETPRCQKRDPAGSPFAPGNKQSMQRTFIPRALAAGVRLLPNCRVSRLRHRSGRVEAALARRDGDALEIRAERVFVCCGAIQTPVLLRRSGISDNVGDNLCIHPMIKAAALFDEPIGAHRETLPVYQVKEFWPTITIGGSVFSPGFLAMLLADNWTSLQTTMDDWERMALFYAGTRGMNRGSVRVLPGFEDGAIVRYRLSAADQKNLSKGLAHLGEILFAAGARAVFPSLRGQPVFRSADQCRGLLAQPAPIESMMLSTVHAFSSCPMGENPDICAADSYGRLHGFRNLYVMDASLLPDSPGVNPQATIMAVTLRNLDHYMSQPGNRPHPRGGVRTERPPPVLVTGAPGWLGTRLVECLVGGLPEVPRFAEVPAGRAVRCLVHPDADPTGLFGLGDEVEVVEGDLADPDALRALCEGARGSVLFHVAGLVHPRRFTRDFERVNVEGTRRLLEAAEAAGVRRVVVVSSNSPFGFNPSPDHVFDESSPYRPYQGYGRSKAAQERLVREAQERGRLETVILRPPWFYGPHQPARQTLFFRMIREGRFPILGDGNQKRSMAYVDNICQGLLLAAEVERASGQAYWIADAQPYTINEIVDTVRAVLREEFGLPCSERRMRLPAIAGRMAGLADGALQALGVYPQKLHVLGEMPHTIACSIARAQAELGFQPTVALREGMRRSIEWCLASGLRV